MLSAYDRTLCKQKAISKLVSRKGVKDKNLSLGYTTFLSRNIPVSCCCAQISPKQGYFVTRGQLICEPR